MSGNRPSFIPKLFVAILIFAFTLWWISPTQCPEVIQIAPMNINFSSVDFDQFKNFPSTNNEHYLGSQFATCKQPMIVTASNAQYFPSLQNLVGSIKSSNMLTITIIDLGMTNEQRAIIKTWCNAELKTLKKEYQQAVQEMDSQAWIPLATDQFVTAGNDVCVLYLDPRMEVRGPLQPVFADMEKEGYWLTHTGKKISMTWLGENDPTEHPELSVATFGIVGKGLAYERIIGPWKNCVLNSGCNFKHLRSSPTNLLNGIVYLSFQQVLKHQTQKDVTIHTEKMYSVQKEEDIDSKTVFYLRPAQGLYPFSQHAGPQCTNVLTYDPNKSSSTQIASAPVIDPSKLKRGNFVVMAANTVVKYCFYIPVSALIWKERYGYEGIILLIGEEQKWKSEPHLQIILKYLNIFGVPYVYILDTPDTYSTSLSQLARIFAAYLPGLDITDDSFIITSDSDLWPIDPNLYKITQADKEILLLNSACCGGFTFGSKYYTMFPMGHIGMSKKTWIEVMNISEEKRKLPFVDMVIAEGTEFFGESKLQGVTHGGKGWYNDQEMISVKIGDWSGYPAKAQKEVPGGLNRIDRAWWPGSFTKESVLGSRDAHLLHGLDNWNRVAEVLKYLVPADKFKLANDYAMEFITAHPEPN